MEIVQQRTPRQPPRKNCRSCGVPLRTRAGQCSQCASYAANQAGIAAYFDFLKAANDAADETATARP